MIKAGWNKRKDSVTWALVSCVLCSVSLCQYSSSPLCPHYTVLVPFHPLQRQKTVSLTHSCNLCFFFQASFSVSSLEYHLPWFPLFNSHRSEQQSTMNYHNSAHTGPRSAFPVIVLTTFHKGLDFTSYFQRFGFNSPGMLTLNHRIPLPITYVACGAERGDFPQIGSTNNFFF